MTLTVRSSKLRYCLAVDVQCTA